MTILVGLRQLPPIAQFPWLMADLSVAAPVVPGQPVSLTWELRSRNLAVDVGDITAKVFLDAHEVYKSRAPVKFVMKGNDGTSGVQTDSISPPFSDPLLGKELYKIGTKTLHLVLTGSGKDNGPYTSEDDLTVTPEPVDSTWWEWTAPVPFKGVEWKRGYSLAGKFINRSQWSKMDLRAPLSELEVWAKKTRQVPNSIETLDKVAPNSEGPVIFPEIKQTWDWLAPVVWVLFGPTVKRFNYTTRFTLTDDYDNGYSGDSDSLIGVVSVSDLKLAAAIGAFVHMVAAAELAVAAIFWPPAWQGAATAVTAANALGAVALDPPEADPRYLKTVRLRTPRVPKALVADKQLAALWYMLELTQRILEAHKTLTQIHRRLIGARVADNRKAVRMQTNSYRSVLAYMKQSAAKLPKAAAVAVRATRTEKLFATTRLRKHLRIWQRRGIPVGVARQAAHAGVSNAVLRQLEKAVRNPVLSKQAASGIEANLGLAAVVLELFAREVQLKAKAILAEK